MSLTLVNTQSGEQVTSDAVLEVRDLSVEFRTERGPLRAVNDVSFRLEQNRVLAVIGESGSGKSAMLRSVLGIQPGSASITGQVLLQGRDLLTLSSRERAATRGRDVSMVFQDPLTALDPVFTVERQLVETLRRHLGLSRQAARARALELLDLVQIPSPEQRLRAYPFELSGGMRQRVVIAMALACEPSVLLADEPTTALDVTVQARILRLLREVQRRGTMSVVIVTHDLAVAAEIADEVAVMYAGRIVEMGPVNQVLLDPAHPYTRGLVEANVQPGQQARPHSIPGAPPSLSRLPRGCAFAPRCEVATLTCWEERPQPVPAGGTRWSRCHLLRSA
ncbi:ABC transporter ATP-binding protein [Actinopolymorpha pittospori]|uniref:Oligopeptide/dipeptide ABC transporter ATP-binding protein n=1 Tax=Actinopolymorpha pittospori TaxID=648752 RepID=A0A927RE53_9ACTN|nr:ABC transporter ATP-binding protein [Actinopolymorpha pittospori]MBE1613172.1 oligopeptide/dipeptide ABC transporter ATP-binding protein [Actinopolymorpha pittospori]